MDFDDKRRQEYYEQWKKFSETGKCTPGIIRPIILESWKRCRAQGLDPMDSKTYYIEDPRRFEKIMRDNNCLISLAKPYMDILGNIVNNTGFIGLLASKEGYVLDAIGDPELVKSAESKFVRPGAIRTESVAGTTAIALCIIHKRPVQVFNAEHYSNFYHDWTCCAAPIFDQDGELAGVLNLSGDYQFIHKHTFGIVVSLARAMEEAFRLRSSNIYIRNCIDSSEYGLAVLDNKFNVKHLNKNLLEYSLLSSDELLGKSVDQVLASVPPITELLAKDNGFFEKSIILKNQKKQSTVLINTKTLFSEDGEHIGKLVVTKKKKEIHNLVNRMVGAYATFTFNEILGKSEQISRVIGLAKNVAATPARVLLQGESGTGKEMFAQAIHNVSDRRDGPFVAINCSAIPSELMESELFGYNEGAFSGAKKGGMPGKFELADGGTLFLDEIDSMPYAMQIKLLRVLEENKITRVGGNVVLPVDVRIIAASGKNMADLVQQGRMRLDLYYRINTIILDIPALRERKEDIPLLVRHFGTLVCQKLGMQEKSFSEDFISSLLQYDWPGNVRELNNVIERTIIISQGTEILTAQHLDMAGFRTKNTHYQTAVDNKDSYSGVKTLEEMEKETIMNVLRLTNNNYVLTARLLGIHRNTLTNKLKGFKKSDIAESKLTY